MCSKNLSFQVLPGGAGHSVEALVWRDGRLFSGSLQATVTEWDVDSISSKARILVVVVFVFRVTLLQDVVDTHGGAAWCAEANHAGSMLAVSSVPHISVLIRCCRLGVRMAP